MARFQPRSTLSPMPVSARSLLLLLVTAFVAAAEPWPSQYLIKPWETARLTAGDVVGPDGIVYPDLRRAGVTGGIPDLGRPEVQATYQAFPVPAGADEATLAQAVSAAIAHARGGGRAVVRLAAGTYRVANPLPTIDIGGVVIAGAGRELTILERSPGPPTKPGAALITVQGAGMRIGPMVPCVGPILRGATVVRLQPTTGFSVGDAVWLGTVMREPLAADATMRRRYDWPASKVFYDNVWNGHFGRGNLARVVAVTADQVTLDRPLAHDLYADESIQLRRAGLIAGCGIQDLTISTLSKEVAIDPLRWESVRDSWLLRVGLRKARNWPISGDVRLNCEMRDCDVDGTWEDINRGSTAYLGWSGAMVDCLMVDCRARDLRHMAIFQGAIRCAVRDCTFSGRTITSPQFHGQFPHDNLVEGCTFDVSGLAWAVDGMATLRHGVEGPRNVLYHSRFSGGDGVASFAGGVEGHIIAYNRIQQASSRYMQSSFMALDRSWNIVVRGNVIQCDPRLPFINLTDASCQGWEVRGNTVHGSNGILAQGDGQVAVNDGNRRLAADAPLAEPRPEARSLIDWEKAHADAPRLVLVPLQASVLVAGAATTLRVTRVRADPAAAATLRLRCEPAGALSLPVTASIPAGAVFIDIAVTAGDQAGEATVTAEADGLLADSERLTLLAGASDPTQWLQADGDHAAPGLPAGWRLADFGQPAAPTSAVWADGRVTLHGGGPAFTTDRNIRPQQRSQLWRTMDGDGVITARVDSVSATAQAGLIVADDAAPTTEFIAVLSDGTVIATGANHTDSSPSPVRPSDKGTAPVWLRLSRKDAVFTAARATVEQPGEADWQELARIDFYADPPEKDRHYRSRAKLDRRMYAGVLLNTTSPGVPATVILTDLRVDGHQP